MKERNLKEISSESFPYENSSESFLHPNTTDNNIQAFLAKNNKPNLDSITSINCDEKETIVENILKPNLESIENDTYENENPIFNLPANSQNHDTNIKIPEGSKTEKPLTNTNFTEKSENKINTIIFLNAKTKRNKRNKRNRNDSEKIKYERENNARKMVGRNFFNGFFLNLIIQMISICNIHSYIEKLPKKFIFNAVKKESKDIINYSFETLINNAESYKVKDARKKNEPSYLGIMEQINLDENKIKLKEKGYDKYLKMNFKELFEEYLKSEEHKKQIEKLKPKKGESEKFKYLSNVFIQGYYN